MKVSAPAKINLGLRILRKRDDGFHDLDTVFLRIGWCDDLTFESAAEDEMTCSDPSLPVDGGNMCMQAIQAVRMRSDDTGGLHLHLNKHLPHGAGLGGGSSDAASCLRAANELLDADLSEEKMHRLAADLGSDVPFFLLDEGVARGTSRGEVLSPMSFPEALKGTWMVVAVPRVRISTPEAFSDVVPNESDGPDLEALVGEGSLEDWRESLVNDFEAHLFARYPQVANLKATLLDAGAGYAAMSGSGSAVFGIFEGEQRALEAVKILDSDIQSWVGPSETSAR